LIEGPLSSGGYTLRRGELVLEIRTAWTTDNKKAGEEADMIARHILFSIEPVA
jgi:hypothetical protein